MCAAFHKILVPVAPWNPTVIMRGNYHMEHSIFWFKEKYLLSWESFSAMKDDSAV